MSARGGLATVSYVIVASVPQANTTYVVANPLPYRESQIRLRELDRRGWDAKAVAVIPATPA